MGQGDTRARVHTGFLRVISEQPYDKLTMKALADELGMSRQNLYRYYSSKEQILSDILEETLEPLLEYAADVEPGATAESHWDVLMNRTFKLVHDNRHVMVAALNSDVDSVVYKIMKSFVLRALGHFIRVKGLTIRDRDYFDVIASYITGGFFQTYKSWAEKDMEIVPEKIAEILKAYSWAQLEALVLSCE